MSPRVQAKARHGLPEGRTLILSRCCSVPSRGPKPPGSPQPGDAAASRAEAVRIFVRGLREGGEIPASDRSYLAQMVAARTGMGQPEAEKNVSDVITQVRAAADEARSAAAKLSLWLTAAMLVGAFSAALAAIEGGQLRDGTWKGVIGARKYRAAVGR